MQVTLDSLQDSPYFVFGHPKKLGNRTINRYVIDSNEIRTKAAEIMLQFLKLNPSLSPTFPVESKDLIKALLTNQYVIINENAVSLANAKEASATSPSNYRDRYFSETYIKEPVQCTKGHFFERTRAISWLTHSKNCPVGDHPMGDLELLEELAVEISEYVAAKQKEDGQLEDLIQKQKLTQLINIELSIEQQKQMQMIEYLKGIEKIDPWLAAGSTGKIAFKFGGSHMIIESCKFFTIYLNQGTKQSGKDLGKSLAKYVPAMSIVIGCVSAIFRFGKGQHEKAVGELISGFSAFIPIVGTSISIAIDIFLGTHDLHEAIEAHKKTIIPFIEMDENLCYKILAIDTKEHPSPSKEIVHRHFNEQIKLLHPDKSKKIKDQDEKKINDLTRLVTKAKTYLYEQKKWS